jgi:hypothetical protein
MSEYLVKVGFWLHAYDSVAIEAATDADAIAEAKRAAKTVMESRCHPETIDTDERRQGIIAYVDRVAPGSRSSVAEDIAFDDERNGSAQPSNQTSSI